MDIIDLAMAAMQEDSMVGYCETCLEEHECLEPDAREVMCEVCGTPTVYGAEELLLRNA